MTVRTAGWEHCNTKYSCIDSTSQNGIPPNSTVTLVTTVYCLKLFHTQIKRVILYFKRKRPPNKKVCSLFLFQED